MSSPQPKVTLSKIPGRPLLLAAALTVLFAYAQADALRSGSSRSGRATPPEKGSALAPRGRRNSKPCCAKGVDATVVNAGISGDDTGRMAARLGSAVPDGTKLVVMEKAATTE